LGGQVRTSVPERLADAMEKITCVQTIVMFFFIP
jgi:hypothetical protein